MADLNKKISDVENEYQGYRVDLKNATSPQEKSELRGLLTELLKKQNELSKGTW